MGHDYIQVHVYYITIFTHSTRLPNVINVYQINFRYNLGLFGIHLVQCYKNQYYYDEKKFILENNNLFLVQMYYSF